MLLRARLRLRGPAPGDGVVLLADPAPGAYQRSDISKDPDYQKFVAENSWWLSDYALFMAVKDRFDGAPWTEWAEDIRLRWANAMDWYRRELFRTMERRLGRHEVIAEDLG